MHGNAAFFVKQVAAGLGCSLYAFVFTYVDAQGDRPDHPVRVGEAAEEGLDEAMHGETAYARCAARARACSGPRPCRRRGQHDLVIGDTIAQGAGNRPLRDRASPAHYGSWTAVTGR